MGLMPTNNQTTPARRPATLTRTPSNSSTASSTSSRDNVVPLLSPIPWLNQVQDEFLPYENGLVATIRPNNGSPETRLLPHLAPAGAPISPTGTTNTPSGGVVDEVDLGTGDGSIGEPISLTHFTATGGGNSLSPPNVVEEESRSLAERFERARSPRVDREEEDVSHFGIEP